jgi:GNAT superfamily N-acetyltransferase
LHITYRPIAPDTDIPRMAEIWNAHIPGTTSVEALRQSEQHRPKDWLLQRIAAVDETDRLLGWSVAAHSPMAEEGRWLLRVTVDPTRERRGIGTHLYDEALRFARSNGATRLDSDVQEALPQGLRFACARGFRVDRHLFESVLEVGRFDETPFADLRAPEGIRLTSMAEMGDNEEARRSLWALEMALNQDVPGYATQGWHVPYDRYCQMVFEEPWYRADTQLLALDGDLWVGMAALRLGEESGVRYMYHNMTGVVASHRRRHIALALKLEAIRCARRYGVTELRTDNDSENAPMVAINRKLGYQPRSGQYKLILTL